MRSLPGRTKIDSIFLGEVEISLLSFPDVFLQVKVGLMEKESGKKWGSTMVSGGWSPTTLQRLNDFVEALEQDVAATLLEGGAPSPSGQDPATPTSDGVPGL